MSAKSVRANLIYINQKNENLQNIGKTVWTNLDFLPIQNVRQYHFHDVANHEKNSPKESVDIKEFYLPVIRWDVAMVTTLIQKLTTKK